MTEDGIEELPFHNFWNRKYVTFDELAKVVPFVNHKLKDAVDVAEMSATWEDTVRYVPDVDEEQGDPNLVRAPSLRSRARMQTQ
eukprot:931449-Rhodomonas_salina.1